MAENQYLWNVEEKHLKILQIANQVRLLIIYYLWKSYPI
jgi:hypothetical protein